MKIAQKQTGMALKKITIGQIEIKTARKKFLFGNKKFTFRDKKSLSCHKEFLLSSGELKSFNSKLELLNCDL
jgi:hypothetical protein